MEAIATEFPVRSVLCKIVVKSYPLKEIKNKGLPLMSRSG